MIVLDSDHDYKTVLKELQLYSPLVSKGCYLIVEDTNIREVDKNFGKNPRDAIDKFLEKDKCFITDLTKERFLTTANPHGYLRKVEVVEDEP